MESLKILRFGFEAASRLEDRLPAIGLPITFPYLYRFKRKTDKMKFLPLLPLLFILLYLASCKDNCEDVQIGTINLGSPSTSFTPYAEGAEVIFQNEQGEQLIFTNQRVDENFRICIKDICTPIDPYKTKTCEYYAAQGIRNILRAEGDLQVELVVSTENYGKAKDLIFYDFFSANFSGMGIQERGEFIAYWHSLVSDFEVEKTIMRTPMVALGTVELLGKTYENVLQSGSSGNLLYFEKGKGVVGLEMNGVLFGLVE